eukprot:2831304-Pleurochrysis_carterae.AAC.1
MAKKKVAALMDRSERSREQALKRLRKAGVLTASGDAVDAALLQSKLDNLRKQGRERQASELEAAAVALAEAGADAERTQAVARRA